MDSDNYNEFEEFFYNMFNFTGVFDEQGCSDIPGGFQDLNPQLFSVIGQVVGMAISGNLPFNIQNAVGNWLMLVGQVIITFNAQQQYFQSGPGRYYNLKYKNVTNPFCPQSNQSSAYSQTGESTSKSKKTAKNTSDMDHLRKEVDRLSLELDRLRKEVHGQ